MNFQLNMPYFTVFFIIIFSLFLGIFAISSQRQRQFKEHHDKTKLSLALLFTLTFLSVVYLLSQMFIIIQIIYRNCGGYSLINTRNMIRENTLMITS